jgi:hypothetical protein
MSIPLSFWLEATYTYLEQCEWSPPFSQPGTEDQFVFAINCLECPFFELTLILQEKFNPNGAYTRINRPDNKRRYGILGWHAGRKGSESSLQLFYYDYTPLGALKHNIEQERTESGEYN